MDTGFGVSVWELIQICALWAGISGMLTSPIFIGVLWYCDWTDDTPINFCFDAVTAVATPFAWVFAILQIIILYRL